MRMIPYLLAASVCFISIGAVDPIVDLSYSKYEGTALPNGVSQWLGIRYAVWVHPTYGRASILNYFNRLPH
jgi:hypothetical protein